MKELGFIERDWQYVPPDNDCLIQDSTIAYEFFKDNHDDDGIVFLVNCRTSVLSLPFVPM